MIELLEHLTILFSIVSVAVIIGLFVIVMRGIARREREEVLDAAASSRSK